jgi:hypothetical protein
VKTSCNVNEISQGIDANKKIKGRKRHIATDVLGLLLAVIVTAASVQDSTAGRQLLGHLAVTQPNVSIVWVDGGYTTRSSATALEGVSASKSSNVLPHRDFTCCPRGGWSNGPCAG